MTATGSPAGEAAAAIARGLEHHRAGRLDAALGEYAAALALDPGNVDGLNLGGLAQHQRGNPAAALDMLSRAVAAAPQFTGALQNLADVQRQTGALDAARISYAKLAALAPDWYGGPYGLGLVLQEQGDMAGARRALTDAIRCKPDLASAHFALANLLVAAGDPAGALAAMERAHAAGPGADSWSGLAVMRLGVGDRAGAEAAARACLALAPCHPGAFIALGQILIGDGRLDEASALAESVRADAASPGDILTFDAALAMARREMSRAVRLYMRACLAYAGAPAGDMPFGDLRARLQAVLEAAGRRRAAGEPEFGTGTMSRLAPCAATVGPFLLAFDDFAMARELVGLAVRGGVRDAAQNLIAIELYDPAATPESFAASHMAYSRHVRGGLGPVPARPPRGPRAKLRVGYVSADFRAHPAANCLLPLFECRDRARFEAYGYSLAPVEDATGARFRALADGWRQAHALTDRDLAAAIRADGIDILVIYAGHFDRNRPTLALHNPAPVVVSFGDCATSGLPETDYLFADAALVPRVSAEPFAERVVRLPCQYVNLPPEGVPEPRPRPAGAALALASFSNPVKLNGATLALWAEVLARLPEATLTLGFQRAFEDPDLVARVRAPFAARGVDLARVRFRPPPADAAGHLAAYDEVDIALDPFPFNGSTTTFEALWMGVPVVTLVGRTMVARWATAILRRVGLGDLCAADAAEYVDTVAALAADPARRAALRRALRGRLAASTTCRPARWMRHVERAYRAVWRVPRTPTRAGRPLG